MSDDIRIKSDGTTQYNGITVTTPYEKESDRGVKVDDFLQLMIAQLSNQDFMNPVDDTQYVTQLAQFATMQSMQELSEYSQTNYVTSLVGKNVTVAALGLGGNVNKDTGLVSSVNLSGDKFTIIVNGKQYELSQIMSVSDASAAVAKSELDEAKKMTVIKQEVGANHVSIRWPAAIADKEQAESLRYDVYITKDPTLDFNDLNSVKRGEKFASELSDTECKITGLASEETYYINVVVRNKKGEEAVYQSTAAETAKASQG